MARLTDAQIVQIKQQVSLKELAESQGHALKKVGKDYELLCPFHAEQTPSCKITPSKNLFHCFGCGEGGSVIDWLQKTEKLSFRKACEKLMTMAGMTTEPEHRFSADSTPRQLLHQVIDFYHDTLKQSPEAMDYLKSRGLDNIELIETFKLGFANRTLGYHLPSKDSQAGKQVRQQLKQLGILREKTGHEHFNGSVIVPIMDAANDITELYGRKITRDTQLPKGTALHTYLPGPHVGIWNAQALQHHRDLILCESLIDAMTFWVQGFKNVTATYGTQGFTQELEQAISESAIEKIYLAFDRDEAGNAAATDLANKLAEMERVAYRVQFPHQQDANSFTQGEADPKAGLARVLRQAEWLAGAEPPCLLPAEAPPREPAALPIEALDLPPALAAELVIPPDVKTLDHVLMQFAEREYKILGLGSNNRTPDRLKVTLIVKGNHGLYADALNLYHNKHRQSFIRELANELHVGRDLIKAEVAEVLRQCERLRDDALAAEQPKKDVPVMSDEELQQAMALLQTPNLCDRVLQDIDACGYVGEHTNKVVAYLAATSRKLDKPLAVMVQSSSAAGKSSLMNAILAMMPDEEKVQYSAMTGQSLFYMGETNLQHKILAIAEEEGASNTSYALKLLQSEGEVTIASTGKNITTGHLETQEYRVEGPVMLFSTTTAIDIDEELMNRCLVLSVDESRAQTEAILAQQRKNHTLEGLKQKLDRPRIRTLHQNAQRLLRPIAIMNPYAEHLTFLSDRARARRDHEKYLALIHSVTFLHQYQREVKRMQVDGETVEYIEVAIEDIAMANQLANEILGHSLDELPPQTRKLLNEITRLVEAACANLGVAQRDYRFSRKAVRTFTHWSDFQVQKHMRRLVEMEYLLVHQGRRGQSFEYELLYSREGDHHERFMMGLRDVEGLERLVDPVENPLLLSTTRPQIASKWPANSQGENAKYAVIEARNAKTSQSSGNRTAPKKKTEAS